MINRKALGYVEGECGAGGVQPVGYYGFVEDVLTFPKPATAEAAAEYADMATIATDIVMKSGKTMYAMTGELETAGLKGSTIGERGSRSKEIKATWFRPGTSAENLGFARYTQNRKMFFILKEQSDRMRVVGSTRFPAEMTSEDDTGTKVADRNGVTFDIGTFNCGAAPVYTGTIPVDSAQDLGM